MRLRLHSRSQYAGFYPRSARCSAFASVLLLLAVFCARALLLAYFLAINLIRVLAPARSRLAWDIYAF